MNDKELREKNLKTIYAFLECKGPERKYTRAPLFTPDGRKEMELRIEGKVILQNETAQEWLDSTAEMFPDWGFYDNTIFQCDDPNVFLVKSNGRGHQVLNGETTPVNSFYINEFLMEDGKIKRFRETLNPCEKLHVNENK